MFIQTESTPNPATLKFLPGQTVLEIIDPASIWVSVRFDQMQSRGLGMELPASILLRSQSGQGLTGHVARVEPLADAITEEIMAKVVFDQLPDTLPPVGELAEITVALPELTTAPVVPNASIKHLNVSSIGTHKPSNRIFESVERAFKTFD